MNNTRILITMIFIDLVIKTIIYSVGRVRVAFLKYKPLLFFTFREKSFSQKLDPFQWLVTFFSKLNMFAISQHITIPCDTLAKSFESVTLYYVIFSECSNVCKGSSRGFPLLFIILFNLFVDTSLFHQLSKCESFWTYHMGII